MMLSENTFSDTVQSVHTLQTISRECDGRRHNGNDVQELLYAPSVDLLALLSVSRFIAIV